MDDDFHQTDRGIAQLIEQRSPKPSVACSTRVSPAKSKHFVLAFCFKKRGAQVSTQSICKQMQPG